MERLSELEIRERLEPVTKRIKMQNNFSRADIQDCLNRLYGKGFSPERKKEILKKAIEGTGIKKIGLKTLYTPRADHSIGEEDKTLKFLDDIYSYRGVVER